MGYVFQSSKELKEAAELWCGADTKEQARSKYGDIGTWEVGAVTEMEGLFKDKSDFNDDISAWETANEGAREAPHARGGGVARARGGRLRCGREMASCGLEREMVP